MNRRYVCFLTTVMVLAWVRVAFPVATTTQYPLPKNGSNLDSRNLWLRWLPDLGIEAKAADFAYHVYIGTDEAVVTAADTNSPCFMGTTDVNRFRFPANLPCGTYYWRADPVNTASSQIHTGPTWKLKKVVGKNPFKNSMAMSSVDSYSAYGGLDIKANIKVINAGENLYHVDGANLLGDPENDCIIGGSYHGKICAYTLSGKRLWDFQMGGFCFDLCNFDIDGDARDEVLATCGDGQVYAIDDSGTLLWKYRLDGSPAPCVDACLIDQGKPIVVAGSAAGRVVVLSAKGTVINEKVIYKISTSKFPVYIQEVQCGDFDGDGTNQLFLGAFQSKNTSESDWFTLPGLERENHWSKPYIHDSAAFGFDLSAADLYKEGRDVLVSGRAVWTVDQPEAKEYWHSYHAKDVIGGYSLGADVRSSMLTLGDFNGSGHMMMAKVQCQDVKIMDAVTGMAFLQVRAPRSFTDGGTVRSSGKDLLVLGCSPNGGNNMVVVDMFAGTQSLFKAFQNMSPTGLEGDIVATNNAIESVLATWSGTPAKGSEFPMDIIYGDWRHATPGASGPIERAAWYADQFKAHVMDVYAYPSNRLRWGISDLHYEKLWSYFSKPDGSSWFDPRFYGSNRDHPVYLTKEEMEGLILTYESKGVPFQMRGGHGGKIGCTPDMVSFAISNAPNTFMGFHAGECLLGQPGYTDGFYGPVMKLLGTVTNRNLYFSVVLADNNWIDHRNKPLVWDWIYSPPFRDGFSVGPEDPLVLNASLSFAGVLGTTLSGQAKHKSHYVQTEDHHAIKQFSWAQQQSGHTVLRDSLAHMLTGGDDTHFAYVQNEYGTLVHNRFVDECLELYAALIGKGVIASPRNDQLKNISPVGIHVRDIEGPFANRKQDGITQSDLDHVGFFPARGRWFAHATTPEWDISRHLYGQTKRGMIKWPDLGHGYGFPVFVPGRWDTSNPDLTLNRWKSYWRTDTETFEHRGVVYHRSDPNALKKALLEDLERYSAGLPFRTFGDRIFSSTIFQHAKEYHLFLMDQGWVDPGNRTATIKCQLAGNWQVKDRITGKILDSSLSQGAQINVAIPAGSFRLLEVTGAAPNTAPRFVYDTVVEANAQAGMPYTTFTNCTLDSCAVDPDHEPVLTYTKLAGPDWLTVSSNGVYCGTPDANDVGMNEWTVQVEDGNGGLDTATLRIHVNSGRSVIAPGKELRLHAPTGN